MIVADDNEMTWFLAQLKPNSHQIAERNLQRQGFTTFLPMHERTRLLRGRAQTRLVPLFPGYIFIAFETASGKWQSVANTSGVTRLVSFGGAPAAVPGNLIAQLKQRFDNAVGPEPSEDLRSGDSVRFISGPFAEFVTKIEEIDADKRIWVLIELMGRSTRIAVNPATIRTT